MKRFDDSTILLLGLLIFGGILMASAAIYSMYNIHLINAAYQKNMDCRMEYIRQDKVFNQIDAYCGQLPEIKEIK